MAEPIVLAEDFGYRYPGRPEPALDTVSFALEPGSFTVLAGESASGKSTLLRAVSGLVPHFHGGEATGDLHVGGLSIRDHGPGDLSEVCGSVFQDPETQVVMGGPRAEIGFPLEHRGDSPASVARTVEETALALGIAHLLDRRTDSLSGGELQRLALAAALAPGPALLALDEPTSQLDPVAGDELLWLLRRLNEESGTAVLVSEHRLERCLPAADRVIALVEGRLACDSAPAEFLAWATEEKPGLATPLGSLFSLAGLRPPPASVKVARSGLETAGLLPSGSRLALGARAGVVAGGGGRVDGSDFAAASRARDEQARQSSSRRFPRPWRRRVANVAGSDPAALELRDVWLELRDGPVVLRGVDLRVDAGERVAVLGRNGAGKSTLLRLAKGVLEPTRGRVERSGEVALLLQNPGDYLVRERVDEELSCQAMAAAGLAGREAANPRDLSGGERQRLALEVVLAGGPCAAVLLDEPTRGMDRAHKDGLAGRIRELAAAGAAVVVATHDTEFAASFADRVVLLGQGIVIGDGPPAEVLGGGRHFSTEVARVTAGAALLPEEAARVLVTPEVLR
jgi:energy-coupling factor transport system ATP-binding protein